MCVQRDYDEMDKVDGEREVRDQLAARDQEKKRYYTAIVVNELHISLLVGEVGSYVKRASSIQHKPSVHPVVTSPRTFRQSKNSPGVIC